MKKRTKIQAAALFAAIVLLNAESAETEKAYFAISVPTQALLNYSLDLAASFTAPAPVVARHVNLAQLDFPRP